MRWIMNRKRYQPGHFLGGILVLTAELALLSICLLLFQVVAQSRETDWYQEATKLQVSTDVFAGIKNENIFIALSVAVCFVILFVVISVCILRRLQLEQMQKQLGMFLTCGYTRRRVACMLGLDIGTDLVIAIPFTLLVAEKILDVLKQKEEFLVMLSVVGVDSGLLISLIVLCVVLIYVLLAEYEKMWLRKCVKGGLAPLIRQNG